MSTTRREFLARSAAGLAVAAALDRAFPAGAADTSSIRVGACVVDLEQGRQAGLDGVEVRVGPAADVLEIAGEAIRERYKEQMHRTGLAIPSLMMGLLNDNPLARDPRAPAWLDQSIDAARDLGAKVILVAFFDKGDLLGPGDRVKEDDVSEVVPRLRVAAPRARDAGVTLAIENYLDADQNARILDRIGSDAVKVYYDCYNTGGTRGYDVPAEVRKLAGRIAQFHFKNAGDFLEGGKVRYTPIVEAIRETGFSGWVVLETSSPTGDAVADAKRNADYARRLLRSSSKAVAPLQSRPEK